MHDDRIPAVWLGASATMTAEPIPGAIRGETPEQAERRANIEAMRGLNHADYRKRVAELSHPAPMTVPVIPKHANAMTAEEFAAAVRQLRNHR